MFRQPMPQKYLEKPPAGFYDEHSPSVGMNTCLQQEILLTLLRLPGCLEETVLKLIPLFGPEISQNSKK